MVTPKWLLDGITNLNEQDTERFLDLYCSYYICNKKKGTLVMELLTGKASWKNPIYLMLKQFSITESVVVTINGPKPEWSEFGFCIPATSKGRKYRFLNRDEYALILRVCAGALKNPKQWMDDYHERVPQEYWGESAQISSPIALLLGVKGETK